MVDPYKSGMFKSNPYAQKNPCLGKLVVILDGKIEERRLRLITPISRAVQRGEIHELIVTDEENAAPGTEVNKIAYWGFFEVQEGTVIVAGDQVKIGENLLGTIAGFDETHMPNHINIVVKAHERRTGVELGFNLNDTISIY